MFHLHGCSKIIRLVFRLIWHEGSRSLRIQNEIDLTGQSSSRASIAGA
jgi:hypothetical protein